MGGADMADMKVAPNARSSFRPHPLLQFLIVTLELEFPVTSTKQTSHPFSNRYKTPLLYGTSSSPSSTLQPLAPNLRFRYPFAQFPNHFSLRPARMLPLEIAPRRLG